MLFGVDAEVNGDTVPVAEIARVVEGAGLESLLFIQRTHVLVSQSKTLLNEPGHERDAELFDPFIASAVAATVTSRIRVGTGACYLAIYDPVILARQVVTLDHVSDGRFLFGVTPGWDESEFHNHGVDASTRFRVMREKALALKVLWTQQAAAFQGEFVNIDPVWLGLRPVQQPHPPVLVGSHGPKGLARVVEYGDAWFPVLDAVGNLEAEMADLERLCRASGRQPVPTTVFLWEMDEDRIAQCANAGVERCVVYLQPSTAQQLDSSVGRLAELADRYRTDKDTSGSDPAARMPTA